MPRELLRKISRLVRYRKIEAVLRPLLSWPMRVASRRRAYRRAVARAVGGPRPPVLVYAMPKVASTAAAEALRSIEGVSVFQVHLISAAGIRRLRDRMRRRGLDGLGHDAGDIADLGQALDAGLIRPRCPAKIVSLVREPIARNISFYFETLDVLWQTENAHEKVGLECLMAEFKDRFTHERVLEWFDTEFKPTLGIDVYEHTFPREAGFLRIDSGLTKSSSCGTTSTTVRRRNSSLTSSASPPFRSRPKTSGRAKFTPTLTASSSAVSGSRRITWIVCSAQGTRATSSQRKN